MMNAVKWNSFLLLFILVAMAMIAGCTCDDDDDDNDAADDDDTGDDDTGDDDTDDDTTDDDTDDDDDDTTPSPAEPFIEAGKAYLRLGAGDLAREQFLLAKGADAEHEGGYYGNALADLVHDFDVISIIDSYIEMLIGFQPPEKDGVPDTGQGMIDQVIQLALEGLVTERSDELVEQVEWLRTEAPDVIFELDRMPIILFFEEVADFHGDFDLPDAVAAEAMARLLGGLIEHLLALNLDFNIGVIFDVKDMDWGDFSTEEIIGAVIDIGLALLDDPAFPNVFTLKEDGALFKAAGLKMGLGWANAAETYSLIIAETTPQTAEVFGYSDLNGDSAWQENEPLYLQPWEELNEHDNQVAWEFRDVFQSLADSFLDYTEYDTDPENPQPFNLSELNVILHAIGLPSLIPSWALLDIDFGAAYRDADPTAFRDTLVAIFNLLDPLFPDMYP